MGIEPRGDQDRARWRKATGRKVNPADLGNIAIKQRLHKDLITIFYNIYTVFFTFIYILHLFTILYKLSQHFTYTSIPFMSFYNNVYILQLFTVFTFTTPMGINT